MHKTSSTPSDPGRAVREGLSALTPDRAGDLHYSGTVATNAFLEGRTERSALLVTEGFGDILKLGRGERTALYSLNPPEREAWSDRVEVFEVRERVRADGTVERALTEDEVERLLRELAARPHLGAVALCLLHSHLRPLHEELLSRALTRSGYRVFPSHLMAPGPGEYERACTSVAAAGLSQIVSEMLRELDRTLSRWRLALVGSSGALLTPREAVDAPFRLALSGPAAGLRGAREVGQSCQHKDLITLDMGGTSTDLALLEDLQLPFTWQTRIGDVPLRAPTLEIHTVGAGGGSLAYVDAGGLLRVGPRSAGSHPGPACYGRGGTVATVTDALHWMGLLPPSLGSDRLELDDGACRAALTPLADQLGLSLDAAALGILEVALAHLERAVRQVSTGRGRNPQRFTLLPFGGAGPMLACWVAERLGMKSVLVPAWAGVLSAWGALTAPWETERSAAVPPELRGDPASAARTYDQLEQQALESAPPSIETSCTRLVARRYKGQGETLVSTPETDFHTLHQDRFGFARPECPVEWVELRIRLRAAALAPRLAPLSRAKAPPQKSATREVLLRGSPSGARREVPLSSFESALQKERLQGPALIQAETFTLWLPENWSGRPLPSGHLTLEFAQ